MEDERDGCAELHRTASRGDAALVSELLESGFVVNALTTQQEMRLDLATRSNDGADFIRWNSECTFLPTSFADVKRCGCCWCTVRTLRLVTKVERSWSWQPTTNAVRLPTYFSNAAQIWTLAIDTARRASPTPMATAGIATTLPLYEAGRYLLQISTMRLTRLLLYAGAQPGFLRGGTQLWVSASKGGPRCHPRKNCCKRTCDLVHYIISLA